MKFRKYIPLSPSEASRFWAKVDKAGGKNACWPWTAYKNSRGYGQFRRTKPRTIVSAHRLSYCLRHGEPGQLMVCHKCDNPACCNPEHFFLGTAQENADDMVAKGRQPKCNRKGENNGRAKLSSHDIQQIVRLIGQDITNKEIGRYFEVTHSAISAIRRGKVWGASAPLTDRYQSMRGPR